MAAGKKKKKKKIKNTLTCKRKASIFYTELHSLAESR